MTVSPECGFPSSLQVYRHPLASHRAALPGCSWLLSPGVDVQGARGQREPYKVSRRHAPNRAMLELNPELG